MENKKEFLEIKNELENINQIYMQILTTWSQQIKLNLEYENNNYQKTIILNKLIEIEKYKEKIKKLNNHIKKWFKNEKIDFDNIFKYELLTTNELINKKWLNEFNRIFKQSNPSKKLQIQYENLKKEIIIYTKQLFNLK